MVTPLNRASVTVQSLSAVMLSPKHNMSHENYPILASNHHNLKSTTSQGVESCYFYKIHIFYRCQCWAVLSNPVTYSWYCVTARCYALGLHNVNAIVTAASYAWVWRLVIINHGYCEFWYSLHTEDHPALLQTLGSDYCLWKKSIHSYPPDF